MSLEKKEFNTIFKQFIDDHTIIYGDRIKELNSANKIYGFLNSKLIQWDERWIYLYRKFLRVAIAKVILWNFGGAKITEEECPECFTFVRIYAKLIEKFGALIYPLEEEELQAQKEQHLKDILIILTSSKKASPHLLKEKKYELRTRVQYQKYNPSEWLVSF